MSMPLFIFNKPVLTNGDMSGNLTTEVVDVAEIDIVTIQAVWSSGATPIGTTTVEASLDNLNFTQVTPSSLSVSGNSGSNMYNIDNPGYRYIRMVYTSTSGSGTLNVKMSGKQK